MTDSYHAYIKLDKIIIQRDLIMKYKKLDNKLFTTIPIYLPHDVYFDDKYNDIIVDFGINISVTKNNKNIQYFGFPYYDIIHGIHTNSFISPPGLSEIRMKRMLSKTSNCPNWVVQKHTQILNICLPNTEYVKIHII